MIFVELSSMRRSPPQINNALADASKLLEPNSISFAQRLTCTVAETCEVTGLGRTKVYELIGNGLLTTTTIGRRRLVLVRSLLSLIEAGKS
jgi:excisionase family DNA binding protein